MLYIIIKAQKYCGPTTLQDYICKHACRFSLALDLKFSLLIIRTLNTTVGKENNYVLKQVFPTAFISHPRCTQMARVVGAHPLHRPVLEEQLERERGRGRKESGREGEKEGGRERKRVGYTGEGEKGR